MSEAIAVIQPEQDVEAMEEFSYHAVAINATEMQGANKQIGEFLMSKCAQIGVELAEMTKAFEVAKARKWAHTALQNQVRNITKRKVYYDKLLAAVNAGFTIVPNMQCDIFAIRVKRGDPKWRGAYGNSTYSHRHASPVVHPEKAQELEVGDGSYRNPEQGFHEIKTTQALTDGRTRYDVTQVCTGWQDIEFPFAAAHPVVMEATDHAMKQLIFDRIGIVPKTGGKLRGDPIILGQIIRKQGYETKVTSFLLAWHLDVRTL